MRVTPLQRRAVGRRAEPRPAAGPWEMLAFSSVMGAADDRIPAFTTVQIRSKRYVNTIPLPFLKIGASHFIISS